LEIELKVKDWLQNLGIGDHAPVLQEDDEAEDVTVPLHVDESAKNRFEMLPHILIGANFQNVLSSISCPPPFWLHFLFWVTFDLEMSHRVLPSKLFGQP